MNRLLKDAIADAKAVRGTALANAKAALEEAFAPKLQSMLSHKIKEEMEMEDEEDVLADEPVDAADEPVDAADMDMGDDADMDMGAEEGGDDLNFSIDGSEYEIGPAGEEEPIEEPIEEPAADELADDELAEILRELDADEDVEQPHETEDPDVEGYPPMEEEVDLEEIISALKNEDADPEMENSEMEDSEMEEDLKEAYSVIKYLRTKINEVNLLNAKLLYVNKLFKKDNLNDTQKIKIIETFDRAKNVRETKLIYATLAESIKTKKVIAKKRTMNEGFASAPQKSTQILKESGLMANRFKQLVNFNKNL